MNNVELEEYAERIIRDNMTLGTPQGHLNTRACYRECVKRRRTGLYESAYARVLQGFKTTADSYL